MIQKNRSGSSLRAHRTARQDGYAILLVSFMTALMLLTVIVAAPAVRTERRREQEEEMIWRGKQYVHAIKLYYRKNGRFPTNIDDLTKPKNGSLRYLRQEYKDPMNKEDGKWRLIYVGPSGQLIGSTKPQQQIQMSGGANVGTPAGQAGFGSMQGQGNSQSAFGGSSFGSSNSSFGSSNSSFGSSNSSFGSSNSSFGSQGGFGAVPGTPKSCPISRPRSSNDPITRKDSCAYPSAGSSSARSHGSIDAVASPRTGKISTAAASPS